MHAVRTMKIALKQVELTYICAGLAALLEVYEQEPDEDLAYISNLIKRLEHRRRRGIA
jgi:hypothetical protein